VVPPQLAARRPPILQRSAHANARLESNCAGGTGVLCLCLCVEKWGHVQHITPHTHSLTRTYLLLSNQTAPAVQVCCVCVCVCVVCVCVCGRGGGTYTHQCNAPRTLTLASNRTAPAVQVCCVCVCYSPPSLCRFATQGLPPLRWRWDRLRLARVWLCEDCSRTFT